MDSRDSWRERGNQGVGVELPGDALKVKMKGLELSPRGSELGRQIMERIIKS